MSAYCQDDTIDTIIIAFLMDFGITSGDMQLNLADVSFSCLSTCYLLRLSSVWWLMYL